MDRQPRLRITERGKKVRAVAVSLPLATILAGAGIATVYAIPEAEPMRCAVGEVEPGDTMISTVGRIAAGQIGLKGEIDNTVSTGQVLSEEYSRRVHDEFPHHPNTVLQPKTLIRVCSNDTMTAIDTGKSSVIDIGPIARLENQANQVNEAQHQG